MHAEYLGVTCYDVWNLLSNGFAKKNVCWETTMKQMWWNVSNW